ncbi:S41 family peptidase [Chryseobacterium sp. SSA4.19]|uniref:S41 family peptidase n=1 Tax=Chryseobacterium sp. SSA4.19 TaxID=2919915 RepID=UPI001F4EE236|nr:S41 family peptidase [Chryseobacterium sp. SSA4.19]MCJ8154915.1 S41 family peptidase [Chryseobacterium sp. SSA4.19]
MNKLLITLTFITLLISSNASAQKDSITMYVTKALDIMKSKSVNKSKVNWETLYSTTLNDATKAKTIKETYPILEKALGSLNDAHSKFYPEKVVRAYTLGYKATGQEFPVIESRLIDKKYAYISLPNIGSFNKDDWNLYINTFYAKVNELQKQKPKGWILDLRDNYGGMLYPMYAAVASFLDHKNVVGTKDAEGIVEYFNYKNAKFYEGQTATQLFQLKEKQPKHIKTPIAVLVNKVTGSSAEFITAAFVGQNNVKLIGVNTQGLTSGNQEYKLPDGSFLVLTIGNIVDRNGKEYDKVGEGISTDIRIDKTDDKTKTNESYMNKARMYIDNSRQIN